MKYPILQPLRRDGKRMKPPGEIELDPTNDEADIARLTRNGVIGKPGTASPGAEEAEAKAEEEAAAKAKAEEEAEAKAKAEEEAAAKAKAEEEAAAKAKAKAEEEAAGKSTATKTTKAKG